ncbi:hypothetical protein CCACVL1_00505 [Corchorus capsularis]|uniref:Uncharacterized protein n=1 Tax=Corchorus capsularis TaxID=210143 RepID=A0A1R3KWM5_COCAP|nr:hypothetical protein CCACVL1_00505 [Corchorus capsularis]
MEYGWMMDPVPPIKVMDSLTARPET